MRLLGYPVRTATSVAVALAQIGEFSFMLAAAGKQLGLLDDRAVNAIVAGAIITITLNPLLYRLARPLGAVLGRFIKEPAGSDSSANLATIDASAGVDGAGLDRALIVGYGPVGRTLARLLRENRIEPVIIELNLETVRRLGTEGIAAVYGDVAHRETLEHAGLKHARALILSSSQTIGTSEAIRIARELSPNAWIMVRSNYLLELPALREAGADLVFSGEGEVALSMTESLLERLGATPEQIDRERARIRSELFRCARLAPSGQIGGADESSCSQLGSPIRMKAAQSWGWAKGWLAGGGLDRVRISPRVIRPNSRSTSVPVNSRSQVFASCSASAFESGLSRPGPFAQPVLVETDHQQRGRAVVDFPEADQHASATGQEEGLGEADESLAAALAAQAAAAGTQGHQLRVQFPGAHHLSGRQDAVVSRPIERGRGDRVGQAVLREQQPGVHRRRVIGLAVGRQVDDVE